MAVGEHTRGVELPQGAPPALLRRAREDLVVLGEAEQVHHLGERQVDGAYAQGKVAEAQRTIRGVNARLRESEIDPIRQSTELHSRSS